MDDKEGTDDEENSEPSDLELVFPQHDRAMTIVSVAARSVLGNKYGDLRSFSIVQSRNPDRWAPRAQANAV